MTSPPSADAARPGEWTQIGAISAEHGEILIIANHTIRPPRPGTPWDHWLAYAAPAPERSEDDRIVAITADVYAPDWHNGFTPGHAREDVLIIRTFNSSAYVAEARTCDDPNHDGWCELRLRLHEHRPADPDIDELSYIALSNPPDGETA